MRRTRGGVKFRQQRGVQGVSCALVPFPSLSLSASAHKRMHYVRRQGRPRTFAPFRIRPISFARACARHAGADNCQKAAVFHNFTCMRRANQQHCQRRDFCFIRGLKTQPQNGASCREDNRPWGRLSLALPYVPRNHTTSSPGTHLVPCCDAFFSLFFVVERTSTFLLEREDTERRTTPPSPPSSCAPSSAVGHEL